MVRSVAAAVLRRLIGRGLVAGIVLIAPAVASAASDPCAAIPAPLARLALADGSAEPVDGVVRDGSGGERALSAFRGTGLVVNFWATWCAPCIEEMPALDRLRAALAGSGVDVIAVSEDFEGAAVVGPFFKRNDIRHLDVYVDNRGGLAAALRLSGLPTTVLIDAHGREVGRVVGIAEWDHPDTVAYLRRCLAGPDQ